ncbi:hypothetical protein OPT61_g9925 [Boeremia exigua]|uniref:Uncharacterized protein n=1 Tax=Boeremia exigua TaxID=749465 RepID=A0ACC2HS05_9PLEO|nr:hypothetical protein OPT61_g9925 [Boeremia exigua]
MCNHPVFPSLRARLIAASITVCPKCLMKSHVIEIAETQAALERRGGIFTSRATANAKAEENNRQEMVAHKTLMRRWKLAKIDSYKDLSLLEGLRTDGVDKTRWELQISKALELWNGKENDCSRVPGCMYTDDDDVSNEEKTIATYEMPAYPSTDDVPSTIVRSSYWIDRNRFDSLDEIDVGEDFETPTSLDFHPPDSPPSHLQIVRRNETPDSNRKPLVSSLKRKRSSAFSENLQLKRKVSIEDYITVICDSSASDLSGSLPYEASYKRPHFSYSTAEAARVRKSFYRCSALYTPNTWAPPEGCEYIDTSHFRTPWEVYDARAALGGQTISKEVPSNF